MAILTLSPKKGEVQSYKCVQSLDNFVIRFSKKWERWKKVGSP